MRKVLALVVALRASGGPASVVVDVLVAGPSEASYELTVDGSVRRGRLASGMGPGVVSALESIEVQGRGKAVSASVVFFGLGGVISRCAAVQIPVQRSAAACSPAFVVSSSPSGVQRLLCESTCLPARRAER